MERCIICNETGNGQLIKLRAKGSEGVNKASEARGDTLVTEPGQHVHVECRRSYINPNEIQKYIRDKNEKEISVSEDRKIQLRSKTSEFKFAEHCLFCGKPAKHNHRKRGYEVYPVTTFDIQNEILSKCVERNDKWAVEVQSRIQSVNDLPAADAVYHQTCSTNFRTGKLCPLKFADEEAVKRPNLGRPPGSDGSFMKIVEYIKEHDDEQVTISKLVEIMKEKGGEAFCPKYMRQKLEQYFGDQILITDSIGRPSVVTLRETAASILYEFQQRPKDQDSDSEKLSIIKTAANLLKSEMKSVETNRDAYPSSSNMSSLQYNLEYIPESLRILLKLLFAEKKADLKIASIGQAIMQATRPRALISPLQLGLGVQMHHGFASRYLVETLHSLGFSLPYSEIQKFESCAAASQGIDIPVDHGNSAAATEQGTDTSEEKKNSFIQYVADNVDHNLRTLDGHGTFHGMGIIAAVTPGTKRTAPIPRIAVSMEDLKSTASIDIDFYKPNTEKGPNLTYKELLDMRIVDKARAFDLTYLLTWQLRAPSPSWSGSMHMVQGKYPGKSAVFFMPMIDMNPGDLSCIYSTMKFISKQAQRYESTPVLTFDQPLYWKALTIANTRHPDDPVTSIVLRLGGFHLEMNFLGCIGHIMSGTGLAEILELVYATNAVSHILTGKAVARALRGHMLVDTAIHSLLCPQNEEENATVASIEDNEVDSNVTNSSPVEKTMIEKAAGLCREVIEGKLEIDKFCDDKVVDDIKTERTGKIETLASNRTASLWLQYSEMVELLRNFIRAERTGNWDLHLQAVFNMLPYFAAAGHNLYVKSAHLYLQSMHQLQNTHPDVYDAFKNGHHVIRRSDRFWAGLSSDLVIEQVLMRSLKSSGGMTRGRKMGEQQRAQWLLSMPACADINEAMQNLSAISYHSSDQHKEASEARQLRDKEDVLKIVAFLRERNPFDGGETSLRNIITGEIAEQHVNADTAVEVGRRIIDALPGKNAIEHSFKRANQVVTMNAKNHLKIDGETLAVDPQLLFQRFTTAAHGLFEDPSEIFKYELCSVPSALFDNNGFLREAQKSTLAEYIWNLGGCGAPCTGDDVQYVLDGGWLLHRIPWTKECTYYDICSAYVEYVERRYHDITVVFDGYPGTPTTKDVTHTRRSLGLSSVTVNFTESMPCKSKKDAFLSNQENKRRFIRLLSERLRDKNHTVLGARDDADLLIVQTAVSLSANRKVVVIGEDTDLLVLLCFHAQADRHKIYFKSEAKPSVPRAVKIWDINQTKVVLGEEVCRILPVIHAFTGCDTTSRIFSIGKSALLKKYNSSNSIQENVAKFLETETDPNEITKAGEELFVSLYGGIPHEGLDLLRYRKFTSKVIVGNIFVQVHTLPPTSDAGQFHSLRAYLQCQTWTGRGDELDPVQWGWTVSNNRYIPVKATLPPAPQQLLKIIRCSCKSNCDTKRCSCRKHGLECSLGCGECRGTSCSNSPSMTENDLDD